MRRARGRRGAAGFSLVEILIVVAIIAILASIALYGFRRMTNRGRSSEVGRMFAQIRTREDAYRQEASRYVATGIDENDMHPALIPNGEPTPKTWAPTSNGWAALGMAGVSQVFCAYSVVAGPAGQWGNAGAFVQQFLATPPREPWWAAVAMCDNDNTPGTLTGGGNATYITSSTNGVVREQNVQQ